jgi:hypothetical protein
LLYLVIPSIEVISYIFLYIVQNNTY